MHRALRPRRGARGVDDHREIAVVDLDLGFDIGLALEQIVEILQALSPATLPARSIAISSMPRFSSAARRSGCACRLSSISGEPYFGMVEDVVHVGRAEHGVDGHPDQAGAMNAEQRFDEFDRVVADGRDLLAGLQPARHQVIGKAIGVALDLGEASPAARRRSARSDPETAPPRASADRRSRHARCGPARARRRWRQDQSCRVPYQRCSRSVTCAGWSGGTVYDRPNPSAGCALRQVPPLNDGTNAWSRKSAAPRQGSRSRGRRGARRRRSLSINCPFEVTLVPSAR